jgi:hypothetical protein
MSETSAIDCAYFETESENAPPLFLSFKKKNLFFSENFVGPIGPGKNMTPIFGGGAKIAYSERTRFQHYFKKKMGQKLKKFRKLWPKFEKWSAGTESYGT